MSPTGKKTNSKDKSKHVRVRMYDVGFGDGFVIFIPHGQGFRTLLVDCGSIHSGASGSIETVAKRVIDDVKDETGQSKIDVVVATHRHKDHVSGFASDLWRNVDVGEVWLPWTEHPTDPDAVRIRNKQAALALALSSGRGNRPASPLAMSLALNALSNEQAMSTLHRGFRSRVREEPRYLPEPERSKAVFKTDRLPGVVIRVLGPSRLESVIRDMDPPAGESYFADADPSGLGVPSSANGVPFAPGFVMNHAEYAGAGMPLEPELEMRAASAGEIDDIELAVALEAAVNGTSLMLMLDIGKVRLLLPGDAQWGTWEAALTDKEWGPLFSGTTFYKVGHHGSHNATPKRFVEKFMPKAIPAMTSVCSVKQWKRIPLIPLLDAMKQRNVSVARSDQPAKAEKKFFRQATDGGWVETWLQV